MSDVALPSDRRPQAQSVGQATVVEQSRAVEEVRAAVLVAQSVPRDVHRATADMKAACERFSLAQRAFYSVPNRGSGPSVHLARELARIWGNVHYGVHELRRDDAAGESEMQAFAWDLQTNTRSARTFISPHARMKNKRREVLVDLSDIYLSNQNTGARAVRECIFTVLPLDFTELAQTICRRTLEHGEGKPLPERIEAMISKFREIGVTVAQLEQRVERKRGTWTAGDVASLSVVYTSITRDGYRVEEEFPTVPVTAEEVGSVAQRPTLPAASSPPAVQEPSGDDDGGVLPLTDDKPVSSRARPGSAAQR